MSKITKEMLKRRMEETPIPDDSDGLWDEFQLAKKLNCSVYKVRRDRWAGGGVPFIKLIENGSVRYRPCDYHRFVSARVRRSTSDSGAVGR